jgi:hypothetical protein
MNVDEAKKLAAEIKEIDESKIRMQHLSIDFMAHMQKVALAFESIDHQLAAESLRESAKALRAMADEYDLQADAVEKDG